MTHVLSSRQDHGPKKSWQPRTVDKAKRLQELVVAMLEGRTQTELGEMLGVSQSAIGKIVSGRNRPGVQISDGLERLGLPRSYIFSQKPATDWERYVGMDEPTEAPGRDEVIEAFINARDDITVIEARYLRGLFQRGMVLENMDRVLTTALEAIREKAKP